MPIERFSIICMHQNLIITSSWTNEFWVIIHHLLCAFTVHSNISTSCAYHNKQEINARLPQLGTGLLGDQIIFIIMTCVLGGNSHKLLRQSFLSLESLVMISELL